MDRTRQRGTNSSLCKSPPHTTVRSRGRVSVATGSCRWVGSDGRGELSSVAILSPNIRRRGPNELSLRPRHIFTPNARETDGAE
eukprot:1187691-Prorocentrum_minimum.AAC.3